MKAFEFVKKFGREVAVDVVKNQPAMNSARYRPKDKNYSSTLSSGDSVCMIKLKKLVDAFDVIELCGGLEMAKELDNDLLHDFSECIDEAINLVEQCR